VDRVVGVSPEDAGILETRLGGFPTHFSNPPEEAFDTEKISVAHFPGNPSEKRAVAAAQVEFNGIRILKKIRPGETGKPVLRIDLVGKGKWLVLLRHRKALWRKAEETQITIQADDARSRD
jgi:hypothetical protein